MKKVIRLVGKITKEKVFECEYQIHFKFDELFYLKSSQSLTNIDFECC